MTDNNSQGETTIRDNETDGGIQARRQGVNYLDAQINIFKPSTPFMRDHLKIVWTMFVAWAIIVFGPVTATFLAPGVMTSITVLGFPLHYLLTAIGAPSGALILSFMYARKRDQLDHEYGIDHSTKQPTSDTETVVSDGGADQ
ncbi:DUF4212 domain-containing protein [Haladaptatus caseinilyticus]|uniref:DUF4212 domain-containing protein n=1 Tax=Haladaptatus caseinilyticus TaxID=2993314 RepID=UPI00224AFFB5|nr:DUF4212 domain-containing protein [Haladaptatus caseinilyticus]